ncbi:GNAT family N-acetyltransferase [Cloacibacillus porcorum]
MRPDWELELYEPARLDAALEERLLDIWEQAMLATHDFFGDGGETVRLKRPYVSRDLRNLKLVCFGRAAVKGFAAIAGEELKMLYVVPESFKRGIGAALVDYARTRYGIRYVKVYEQNTGAVLFYKRLGFVIFEKSVNTNRHGQRLSVLRMALKQPPTPRH